MRIIEQFSTAKHPDRVNEDVIVVTDDFVGVLDGVSDKSGHTYLLGGHTVTSGRFAAGVTADALARLDPGVGIDDAVDLLTATLDAALRAQRHVRPGRRPACGLVVYSRAWHEIWSVGDCAWSFRGHVHQPVLAIDEVTTAMRAAVTATHLAAGADLETLRHLDPGRVAIADLLSRQALLANTTGPYGYGVLNGLPVPAEHRHRFTLAGDGDLILASDGYPTLGTTLAETEETLHQLLARDPLCIAELRGTKPLAPGGSSFDDRSWLRVHLNPTS